MSLESIRGLGSGGTGIPDELAKAIAELQGLQVTLVSGANADTQIPITNMEVDDTVISVVNLTDGAQVDPGTVTIGDRRAKGTLTVGTVEDGDTCGVNGKTYTFTEIAETIAYNAPPGIVPFTVASPFDSDPIAARLAKVIMSSDSTVFCTVADNVVTIWNRAAGTVGNSKTLSITGANGHVTRSGATLAGGSATNGISISSSTASKKLLVFWFDKN
ncbi:MAG: hypothetical protein C5B54_05720 [Acidobacteria bacterium]|nr:MAG: hypothetical protein C5B54_05720 [Acidobacteriota bacterium]